MEAEKDYYKDTINTLILGRVVKKLRVKKGLTLRQLANSIRVDDKERAIDPSFISLVERGERTMSYPVLKAVAIALGVEPKWLIALALPVHPTVRSGRSREDSPSSQRVDALGREIQGIIVKDFFDMSLDEFLKEVRDMGTG